MPRIPTQGAAAGATPRLAAPGVTPFRSATGEQIQQLGAGITETGSTISGLAARAQEDIDVAQLKERANLAAELVHKTLSDPDAGFLRVQGKAAVDGRQATLEQLKSKLQGLGDGLPSGLRDRFRQVADTQMLTATEQIDDHVARQALAYNAGETKAAIESNKRTWIESDSPMARTIARATMLSSLNELADMSGIGPKQRDELRLQQLSDMHTQTIDRMLESPAAAKQYLEAYGDEMAPEAKARATSVVTRAVLNDTAQKEAWGVIGEARGSGTLTDQFAAALRMVDEKSKDGTLDADTYDRVLSKVSAYYNRQSDLHTQQRLSVIERARQYLVDNPGATNFDDAPDLAEEIDDLKVGADLAPLLNRERKAQNNPEAFAYATELSFTGGFKRMSRDKVLEMFGTHLDEQHLDRVIAMWADANKVADAKQMRLVDEHDVIESTLEGMGLSVETAKKDPLVKARRAEWLDNIQRAVDRAGLEPHDLDGLRGVIQQVGLDKARLDVWGADPEVPIATVTKDTKAYVTTSDGLVYTSDIPSGQYRGEVGVHERLLKTLQQVRQAAGIQRPVLFQDVAQAWVDLGRPVTPSELDDRLATRSAPAPNFVRPFATDTSNPKYDVLRQLPRSIAVMMRSQFPELTDAEFSSVAGAGGR